MLWNILCLCPDDPVPFKCFSFFFFFFFFLVPNMSGFILRHRLDNQQDFEGWGRGSFTLSSCVFFYVTSPLCPNDAFVDVAVTWPPMIARVCWGDRCLHSFEVYISLHFISFFFTCFMPHTSWTVYSCWSLQTTPFSSLQCTTIYHFVLLHLPRGAPVSQRTPGGGTSQNTASASDPENRGHGSFTCSPRCADTRPYREIYRLWHTGSAVAALVDHRTVNADAPHVSRLSAAILFLQEWKSSSRRIMTVAAWRPHPSTPRGLSMPERASKKRRVMGLGLQGPVFWISPQNTLHSPPSSPLPLTTTNPPPCF